MVILQSQRRENESGVALMPRLENFIVDGFTSGTAVTRQMVLLPTISVNPIPNIPKWFHNG
jgi:hypothetical protein